MLSDVFPKLLSIRASRRFPLGFFGRPIEEIREVLRIRPADLPPRGETGSRLLMHEGVRLEAINGVEGERHVVSLPFLYRIGGGRDT